METITLSWLLGLDLLLIYLILVVIKENKMLSQYEQYLKNKYLNKQKGGKNGRRTGRI